jgi:alkylation response protein AidB-like acyl-CoA dehydrogenase
VTTSNHYKSNLRDIFFNLFEVLEIGQNTLSKAPYNTLDEPTVKDTLKLFETLCMEKVAPGFAEGDQVPLRLDAEGNVHLPEGIKSALQAFHEGDWHRFDMPERLGGFNSPRSVYWSAFEMLVGANPPVALYVFGSFAARIVDKLGTESQKSRYLNNILDHAWGATMVLTEPDAGSDVGTGRTKARHIKDDEWEIEGVKRFITNGDFDTTENIVHLVLARPEGADVGTKGLSLFLVPKFWVDENGKMGARNGAFCTNIEKKMGIKGSATSEMTFGEKMPARGLLLGNVHDGIRQMFQVIEQARMAVGVKSMSTLSTAYLNALEFCKSRVQGPDLLQAMDKHSPRVRIIEHPDVKRMLMLQKSHAEGMRALSSYCSHIQDLAVIAEEQGDKAKAKEMHLLADLLLPLIKGYNSEKVYDLLAVSLQCYGGSGYLHDYPIEQYIRDQKIDSLYEGTTHIQALDLVFRKIAKNGAVTLQHLFDGMRDTLAKRSHRELLSKEYDSLATALGDAEGIMGAMMAKMGESFYHVGFQGNRILTCIAELTIGWLLIKHAEVAANKREKASSDDRAFYEGKIASARFFCQNALPNLALSRSIIENSTLDLMDLPEQAF